MVEYPVGITLSQSTTADWYQIVLIPDFKKQKQKQKEEEEQLRNNIATLEVWK
ncbi:hypothetical protein HYC85_014668 [Camellia sinensis]|uniref:Uncharacterized protein n=1 Tax=Camellia sinensis TaxID=4442 RepID=A0A7J7H8W9_CAMSI|nr:hypothetical protein HYC85_014668 [Camellia sinensis]